MFVVFGAVLCLVSLLIVFDLIMNLFFCGIDCCWFFLVICVWCLSLRLWFYLLFKMFRFVVLLISFVLFLCRFVTCCLFRCGFDLLLLIDELLLIVWIVSI